MSTARPFEPEALLAAASVATEGLSDFGDASFRPGLAVLCDALNREARLSEAGIEGLRQKLLTQLGNRLRVEQWFARHPEIENEVIGPVTAIVGVPRTGTTKLHRLLSRDPRFYTMQWWEAQLPVPFPDEDLKNPEGRIGQARAMCDYMTQAMPKLMAQHPMSAEEADEEVILMEHSFLSAFNAYADVPSYMNWLAQQDEMPAYDYLKRIMKFLQWQKRQRGITAERWVLKAPHHLLRMHLLLKAFPGVKVILTHRDPTTSIPSISSFIHTLWCIYSDRADPLRAGAEWNDIMRRAMLHTMQVRQAAPGQFLDVRFQDTVKAPMTVVRRIWDFLGLPADAKAEAVMERWLVTDEKSHRGGHDYTAEQFGLSEAQLQRDFAEYRARHITA